MLAAGGEPLAVVVAHGATADALDLDLVGEGLLVLAGLAHHTAPLVLAVREAHLGLGGQEGLL